MLKTLPFIFTFLFFVFCGLVLISCNTDQENSSDKKPFNKSENTAPRDKLISYLELKTKQDPDNHKKYAELAEACIQRARYTGDVGYYIRAEKALEKALELEPDSYHANLYMATVKQSKHKFEESVNYLKKAIEIDPESAFTYGVLGDAYMHLGNTKKAEKMYKKMHGINPSLESYSRLSSLERRKNNYESAIGLMQKAYEAGIESSNSPENLAWTQAMTGEIYFEKGDFVKAEEHYKKSLEIESGYYLALQKLGELHFEIKDYEKAEDLYKKVIAVNERPEIYIALGDLYKKTGKYTLSGKQYRKAREIMDKYSKQGFDAFHSPHTH